MINANTQWGVFVIFLKVKWFISLEDVAALLDRFIYIAIFKEVAIGFVIL